ncbi:IS66 family insertion sequence element accessory protein TnpB [Escherichia coli]
MSRAYRTKEQWLALFAEFENSQQRQMDFCAERGIDPKYFSARKHQLRNKKQSDFVQVKPQPLSSLGGNGASVVLQMQSTELILPLSVEPRWLAQLVKELNA